MSESTKRTDLELRLGFKGLRGDDRPHVSVDGMTEHGPNLSHWPGNRTPKRYKRDLSTGICLAFARAPESERRDFLGGVEFVVNDHYDTDGFLSMLSLTRPSVALAREEVLLAAAGTGDFQSFHTVRGFAIDRTVAGLSKPRSPVASEFDGLDGPSKDLARTEWLIENAESVLDRPEDFEPIWRAELDLVVDELQTARLGKLRREPCRDAAMTVLRSNGPLHRMTLNTMAGAFRVLHVVEEDNGPLVRYHDRTESWFEVVTMTPPARRDLREIAARLNELESPSGEARWCADAPTSPIPELWFGLDEPQVYGRVTRTLHPTTLPIDTVVQEMRAALREG
ncbi:MAG: DUF6687 family protein [Planctomycetota bacterium]